MKVFIVLRYIDLDGTNENVRVDRVYTKRSNATKRARFLDKTSLVAGVTYHVIQKTLKGKLPCQRMRK